MQPHENSFQDAFDPSGSFATLFRCGLQAFQNCYYGGQRQNLADILISDPEWVESPNLFSDCVTCRSLSESLRHSNSGDLSKKIVSEIRDGQYLGLERLRDEIAERVSTIKRDSLHIFSHKDGCILQLSLVDGGFYLRAFLSGAHAHAARKLRRINPYYDVARASLPQTYSELYMCINRDSGLSPHPRLDFPNVWRSNLPVAELEADNGAGQSYRNTKWKLAVFDPELADLLAKEGLPFKPVAFSLSQVQMR